MDSEEDSFLTYHLFYFTDNQNIHYYLLFEVNILIFTFLISGIEVIDKLVQHKNIIIQKKAQLKTKRCNAY